MEFYIYNIVCNNSDVKFNYVGSTQNFAMRKSKHKFDSHDSKKAHMRIYKIINDYGGWTCWEMIKIETCYCVSKLEARKRERFIQEMLNADMNTIRPYQSNEELTEYKMERNKQYNIDKKDEISAQKKEYYKKNKDRIAARNSLKKISHLNNLQNVMSNAQ